VATMRSGRFGDCASSTKMGEATEYGRLRPASNRSNPPLALKKCERVMMEQFKLETWNLKLEPLPQKFHKPSILLNRQHLTSARHQQFVSGPKPGPTSSTRSVCVNSAASTMRRSWLASCKKILAERFRQLDLPRRQNLPHLGEFHGV